MLRHYLIYLAIKITLFLANIFMSVSKYSEFVPGYDLWYIFTTCVISIIYGEYIDDIALKMMNFGVLGFLITMYILGYYQIVMKYIMDFLSVDTLNMGWEAMKEEAKKQYNKLF